MQSTINIVQHNGYFYYRSTWAGGVVIDKGVVKNGVQGVPLPPTPPKKNVDLFWKRDRKEKKRDKKRKVIWGAGKVRTT